MALSPTSEPTDDDFLNWAIACKVGEEYSNLTKAVIITEAIAKLKAVQNSLKAAFAHRELDGGAKAAFDHPLYLLAQARINELEEEMVLLI